MVSIGKWGITREESGELAMLWSWPWYWRYPGALAIMVAGVLSAIWIDNSGNYKDWIPWAMGGGAVFFGLCCAYELGCLVLVVAFFAGCWMLSETFFPNFDIPPKWLAIIGIASAYFAWLTGSEARRQADKATRTVDATWQRLVRAEDAQSVNLEVLYEKINDLERRLRQLERNNSDIF